MGAVTSSVIPAVEELCCRASRWRTFSGAGELLLRGRDGLRRRGDYADTHKPTGAQTT